MNRYRGVLPGLLLALMIFTAYAPAFRAGFIWDDDTHLTANAILASPGALRQIWTQGTPVYYPLTFTAFWLERKLWGLDPVGYHLVNIALHSINAILLWFLLRRLRVPGAWFAAAIFALHPVHVESVAWVTELKNCLSGLFSLLALYGYLRFEEGEGRKWYWTALSLFLLALFSKSAICTLPAALLLMRWYRGREIDRRALLDVLPFVALAGALAVATVHVEHGRVGAGGPEFHLSLAQRVLVAGHALWFYAAKLVWPARLAFVYERWQVDPRVPSQWLWVLAVLAAAAALWRLRDRLGRGPVAGVLFFAVTLAPVLGFISFYYNRYSFVADHFQYVPGIGLIAVATGIAAHRLSGRRRVAASLGAVVLLLLGSATWQRAHAFKDPVTLWNDTLAKNPSSWMAHNNLGATLDGLGRKGEAISECREALRLKPDYDDAHYNLALFLQQRGDIRSAVEHYEEALRLSPWNFKTHNNLGMALVAQGRVREAVAEFRQALQTAPMVPYVHRNLGLALQRLGATDEAAEQFREAVRLDPSYADARKSPADDLGGQARDDEPLARVREGLRLAPQSSEAHYNLGLALHQRGRIAEAIVQYREALRLRPDNVDARNNLGVALLSAGRAAEAADQQRQALRANPKHPYAHYNLGLALQGLGKTAEAMEEFQQALKLKPDYAEAQFGLGDCLDALKRPAEALAHYQAALRINPGFVPARERLARDQRAGP
ncbi:MAG: tetratricopeptide repeat protein [Elusimicrobia bacterium]|nr:tetratricopeptide repeat protein [Elusimicrobiota bacterium]